MKRVSLLSTGACNPLMTVSRVTAATTSSSASSHHQQQQQRGISSGGSGVLFAPTRVLSAKRPKVSIKTFADRMPTTPAAEEEQKEEEAGGMGRRKEEEKERDATKESDEAKVHQHCGGGSGEQNASAAPSSTSTVHDDKDDDATTAAVMAHHEVSVIHAFITEFIKSFVGAGDGGNGHDHGGVQMPQLAAAMPDELMESEALGNGLRSFLEAHPAMFSVSSSSSANDNLKKTIITVSLVHSSSNSDSNSASSSSLSVPPPFSQSKTDSPAANDLKMALSSSLSSSSSSAAAPRVVGRRRPSSSSTFTTTATVTPTPTHHQEQQFQKQDEQPTASASPHHPSFSPSPPATSTKSVADVHVDAHTAAAAAAAFIPPAPPRQHSATLNSVGVGPNFKTNLTTNSSKSNVGDNDDDDDDAEAFKVTSRPGSVTQRYAQRRLQKTGRFVQPLPVSEVMTTIKEHLFGSGGGSGGGSAINLSDQPPEVRAASVFDASTGRYLHMKSENYLCDGGCGTAELTTSSATATPRLMQTSSTAANSLLRRNGMDRATYQKLAIAAVNFLSSGISGGGSSGVAVGKAWAVATRLLPLEVIGEPRLTKLAANVSPFFSSSSSPSPPPSESALLHLVNVLVSIEKANKIIPNLITVVGVESLWADKYQRHQQQRQQQHRRSNDNGKGLEHDDAAEVEILTHKQIFAFIGANIGAEATSLENAMESIRNKQNSSSNNASAPKTAHPSVGDDRAGDDHHRILLLNAAKTLSNFTFYARMNPLFCMNLVTPTTTSSSSSSTSTSLGFSREMAFEIVNSAVSASSSVVVSAAGGGNRQGSSGAGGRGGNDKMMDQTNGNHAANNSNTSQQGYFQSPLYPFAAFRTHASPVAGKFTAEDKRVQRDLFNSTSLLPPTATASFVPSSSSSSSSSPSSSASTNSFLRAEEHHLYRIARFTEAKKSENGDNAEEGRRCGTPLFSVVKSAVGVGVIDPREVTMTTSSSSDKSQHFINTSARGNDADDSTDGGSPPLEQPDFFQILLTAPFLFELSGSGVGVSRFSPNNNSISRKSDHHRANDGKRGGSGSILRTGVEELGFSPTTTTTNATTRKAATEMTTTTTAAHQQQQQNALLFSTRVSHVAYLVSDRYLPDEYCLQPKDLAASLAFCNEEFTVIRAEMKQRLESKGKKSSRKQPFDKKMLRCRSSLKKLKFAAFVRANGKSQFNDPNVVGWLVFDLAVEFLRRGGGGNIKPCSTTATAVRSASSTAAMLFSPESIGVDADAAAEEDESSSSRLPHGETNLIFLKHRSLLKMPTTENQQQQQVSKYASNALPRPPTFVPNFKLVSKPINFTTDILPLLPAVVISNSLLLLKFFVSAPGLFAAEANGLDVTLQLRDGYGNTNFWRTSESSLSHHQRNGSSSSTTIAIDPQQLAKFAQQHEQVLLHQTDPFAAPPPAPAAVVAATTAQTSPSTTTVTPTTSNNNNNGSDADDDATILYGAVVKTPEEALRSVGEKYFACLEDNGGSVGSSKTVLVRRVIAKPGVHLVLGGKRSIGPSSSPLLNATANPTAAKAASSSSVSASANGVQAGNHNNDTSAVGNETTSDGSRCGDGEEGGDKNNAKQATPSAHHHEMNHLLPSSSSSISSSSSPMFDKMRTRYHRTTIAAQLTDLLLLMSVGRGGGGLAELQGSRGGDNDNAAESSSSSSSSSSPSTSTQKTNKKKRPVAFVPIGMLTLRANYFIRGNASTALIYHTLFSNCPTTTDDSGRRSGGSVSKFFAGGGEIPLLFSNANAPMSIPEGHSTSYLEAAKRLHCSQAFRAALDEYIILGGEGGGGGGGGSSPNSGGGSNSNAAPASSPTPHSALPLSALATARKSIIPQTVAAVQATLSANRTKALRHHSLGSGGGDDDDEVETNESDEQVERSDERRSQQHQHQQTSSTFSSLSSAPPPLQPSPIILGPECCENAALRASLAGQIALEGFASVAAFLATYPDIFEISADGTHVRPRIA